MLTLLRGQALSVLDARIRQSGGVEALEQSVERPRYELLKKACEDADIFFVVLHQIFCLWSFSPRETHKLYIPGGHDPSLIGSAFVQLSTILRSNSVICSEQLSWLVQFPGPHDVLRRSFPEYSRVVRSVLDFLVHLAQSWMAVIDEHRKLGYPLLVDEMLSTFQLHSSVLQTIAFKASRRTCGIADGPVGTQMDKLFKEDQARHLQADGCFHPRTYREFHEEPMNQTTIKAYQALAAKTQVPNIGGTYTSSSFAPDLRQQAFLQQRRLNNSWPSQARTQTCYELSCVDAVCNSLPAVSSPILATAQPGPGTNESHAPTSKQQPYMALSPVSTQFQMWSSVAPIEHLPENVQQSPTNHSPNIAQGHLSHAEQMQGFRQQPVPLPLYHQQALVMRHSSRDHVQAAHASSFQPRTLASLSIQASPGRISPVDFKAATSQSHENFQSQLGGRTSPSVQNHVQVSANFRQMRNPAMTTPMNPIAGNVHASLTAPGAGSPSGEDNEPPRIVQQDMKYQHSSQHPHQFYQQVQRQTLQHSFLPQQQRAGQQPLAVTFSGQLSPITRPSGIGDSSFFRIIHSSPTTLPGSPYDPYDRNSIATTLHQAGIRSPKRMLSGTLKSTSHERYYQYVKYLALSPSAVLPHPDLYTFHFGLSGQEYAKLSRDTVLYGNARPSDMFSNGSVRVRLRCVFCRHDVESIPEGQWVKWDTVWPDHTFIQLNGHILRIGHEQHYRHDQPVEVDHCVVPGRNELKVLVPPNTLIPLTKKPFIAIEVVETLSHSSVLALNNFSVIHKTPAEQTLNIIKTRLRGSPCGALDGDVTMLSSDLAIRITDPFSSRIFDVPVRGISCEHLDCFDLETWLNTRPTKNWCVCGSKGANCGTCPKEPSLTDKWKCPICGEDARPQVLRIDGFLSEVRATLAAQNELATKDIAVSADGSWKPIVDSGMEEGGEGSGVGIRPALVPWSARPQSVTKAVSYRAPIEIITLDDD